MAYLLRYIFCVVCVVLFCSVISTEETASLAPVAACPADSTLDPQGGCVCNKDRCSPPPTCTSPATLVTRGAAGVPGDCCDVVDCVMPTSRSAARECSGEECPTATDCPGDSYRLDGVECQCLPKSCQTIKCPTGRVLKLQRPGTGTPGLCCPLYDCVVPDSNIMCRDNGTERENGSTWFRPDCTECRCDGGLIFCDSLGYLPSDVTTICTPLPPECSTSRVPPGQCCPVCVDKTEEIDSPTPPGSCVTGLNGYGRVVKDGESWQEDDCTSCVCKDGHRQCQAYMCEACANPQYEPGECCPRCDGTTVVTVPSHCPSMNNCSLRCVHGFVRDLDGCFTCHCQQDECLLECQHGYAEDTHGNKLCKCNEPKCPPLMNCRKSCPHGYRTNKQGCEICRCESCKPLDQCTKRCTHGLVVNANNCVICKCIPYDSHRKGPGNSTEAPNGTPCISDAKVWRDDGESWSDGCRQCYCLAGREMCSLLSCPTTSCTNPVYNSSKDCCPYCPGTELIAASHMVCQGEEPGKIYLEGETWRLSPCVECLCQSGRALCHASSCPPTPCRRPIPSPAGECCPTCPLEQLNNSSLSTTCERRQGESMWREGNCVSCLCEEGRPTCYTELCEHQVSCNNALQVKNQCCPICLDKLEGAEKVLCTIDNVTYTVGQDWEEDECTSCECIAGGEISCTKLVCSVNCPNPVRKPGVCCHVCPEAARGELDSGRELVYIVLLSVVAGAALVLGVYVARQCKLKRHQLKLQTYGCPPPQYTQYKYMPTYDSPQAQTGSPEKTALTPL